MKDKLTLIDRVRIAARPAVFSVIGLGAIVATQPALAGTFGVQVVDEAGVPVVGASVCVGLPGNYKQFGALFTDVDGRAAIEVPNIPIVVTVSKTRFSGIRINEPARGFNLEKRVTMVEGVPGPRCRAGSTLASESSIVIEDLEILEGVFSTTLRPLVTGQPTHYRVGLTPDIGAAQWQTFDSDVVLSASLSDADIVYLQMRRYEGSSKAWLESRSKVVTVQLPVPANLN